MATWDSIEEHAVRVLLRAPDAPRHFDCLLDARFDAASTLYGLVGLRVLDSERCEILAERIRQRPDRSVHLLDSMFEAPSHLSECLALEDGATPWLDRQARALQLPAPESPSVEELCRGLREARQEEDWEAAIRDVREARHRVGREATDLLPWLEHALRTLPQGSEVITTAAWNYVGLAVWTPDGTQRVQTLLNDPAVPAATAAALAFAFSDHAGLFAWALPAAERQRRFDFEAWPARPYPNSFAWIDAGPPALAEHLDGIAQDDPPLSAQYGYWVPTTPWVSNSRIFEWVALLEAGKKIDPIFGLALSGEPGAEALVTAARGASGESRRRLVRALETLTQHGRRPSACRVAERGLHELGERDGR